MSGPIVFVSHFRVKGGHLDRLGELTNTVTSGLQAEKPRTLVYLAYVDDGGTTATFVHVFADAESMTAHFEGSGERSALAYEVMDPAGWEIYGAPDEATVESMRQAAASAGVALTVEPNFLAGFLRLGR
jgi:quinol monooxygenase YgiN